jgi:poly(3-hydroxyalkanoate) synthetase
MPLLNIYAEQDHLVPPSSSKPLGDLVSSKDVTTKSFPVGHIGMYVSSKSQKELSPTIADWITQRSSGIEKEKATSRQATSTKATKKNHPATILKRPVKKISDQ